jgi:glycogen debranching enzyme
METPFEGVVTHQNAEFVKALHDTAFLSNLLGHKKDAETLLQTAEKIKRSMNEYLWDDGKKAFFDCVHKKDGTPSQVFSMQTNIMAYLCGCVDGDRKKLLESYLVHPPEGFVRIGTPFMAFFYIDALYKNGYSAEALSYMEKQWGEMLKYDATTCWEGFKGGDERITRSHCHAWSAAPGYFLGAYVLGIRPMKPGFGKVLIDIHPDNLEWARGHVPTPRGNISVAWEQTAQGLKVDIYGPQSIVYTLSGRMKRSDCKVSINTVLLPV